jgi:hypothetical protein
VLAELVELLLLELVVAAPPVPTPKPPNVGKPQDAKALTTSATNATAWARDSATDRPAAARGARGSRCMTSSAFCHEGRGFEPMLRQILPAVYHAPRVLRSGLDE